MCTVIWPFASMTRDSFWTVRGLPMIRTVWPIIRQGFEKQAYEFLA
jgi:hypothetical protein